MTRRRLYQGNALAEQDERASLVIPIEPARRRKVRWHWLKTAGAVTLGVVAAIAFCVVVMFAVTRLVEMFPAVG